MNNEQGNRQLFLELEDRLASLEPKDALKVRRDRWVFVVMFAGTAMTVPSMLGAKGGWISWLTIAGLMMELCALAVLTYRQVRDVVPDFVDAKRKYAVELDTHFIEHEKIRRWLRSLESSYRHRRLAYVEARLESLMQRYPIVFGATDRLGVLPALIGLFLQLQAIETLSLATGVIGVLVIALYGMALWMARFRLQLQSYARVLKAAESD